MVATTAGSESSKETKMEICSFVLVVRSSHIIKAGTDGTQHQRKRYQM